MNWPPVQTLARPWSRACWNVILSPITGVCNSKSSLFWRSQLSGYTGNLRKTWSAINSVLGRTQQPFESERITNEVIDFCTSKVNKIRSDISSACPPSYSSPISQWLSDLPLITEDEISKLNLPLSPTSSKLFIQFLATFLKSSVQTLPDSSVFYLTAYKFPPALKWKS